MHARDLAAGAARAVLLTAAFAAVLGLGLFGCQGCQSSSAPGESGSPDEVLSGSNKKSEPNAASAPAGGREPAAPADRDSARLEAAMEFVENELMALRARAMGKGREDGQDFKKRFLEDILARADRDKKDLNVRYLLGYAYFLNENPEKAEEAFREVVAQDEGFLPAWKGIALIRARAKDDARVREAVEHLTDPRVQGPYGRILYAEFQADGGREQEAEKLLLDTRDRYPANVRVLLDLVDLYRVRKRWEEAFATLEKAVQRAPENPKVWFFKAETHSLYLMVAMEERNTEAVGPHRELLKDALEQCAKLAPDSVIGKTAKENLGMINRPQDRLVQILEDTKEVLAKRMEAIARLAADPSRIPFENWVRYLEFPEKELRGWAMVALGRLATREAIAKLGDLAGKGEVVDRSTTIGILAEVARTLPDKMAELRPVVVPLLLAAVRFAIEQFEKTGRREESDSFADACECLTLWTSRHFQEGRDGRKPAGMKEILGEWEGWWSKEPGAAGAGAGGAEEKKG